jgi:hypothetical protein
VQMKIKISALLMEAGVSYNKQRLHKAGYFRELLATNRTSMKGCARCCEFAARRWCAWGRLRVPWCAP